MRNCFQSDHTWLATTQNSLSSRFGLGLGCRRLYTASCCRRTRFSSSRLRRAQNRRAMVPRQSRMMLNIASFLLARGFLLLVQDRVEHGLLDVHFDFAAGGVD